MKPNFDTMSMTELRAYLLSHRTNDEAFYKLADSLEVTAENSESSFCHFSGQHSSILKF